MRQEEHRIREGCYFIKERASEDQRQRQKARQQQRKWEMKASSMQHKKKGTKWLLQNIKIKSQGPRRYERYERYKAMCKDIFKAMKAMKMPTAIANVRSQEQDMTSVPVAIWSEGCTTKLALLLAFCHSVCKSLPWCMFVWVRGMPGEDPIESELGCQG